MNFHRAKFVIDLDGVINRRQLSFVKFGVKSRADNLGDTADYVICIGLIHMFTKPWFLYVQRRRSSRLHNSQTFFALVLKSFELLFN